MAEWKLFVDDDRIEPSHGWTFAPHYDKAIELINNFGLPIDMSLDHDIWIGPGRLIDGVEYAPMHGGEFVLWLEEYVKTGHQLPQSFKYSIHSSNEGGRDFMHDVMKRITGQEATHLKVWW